MIPLVAKTVPPLSHENALAPDRIMALIDQARWHKITFISSFEGYGKTTVLTQWYNRLRAEGRGVVWFTCDSRDQDVDRFWMNFHYAASSAFGDIGVSDYDSLRSLSLPEAMLTLANQLCLTAREHGGLFIIVERFDLLEGAQSMETFMLLVQALSDDVHLVLSSRRVYNKYSFSGVHLSEMPLIITTSDLAFTESELGSYLNDRLGDPLTSDQVSWIFQKTLGWPFAASILASCLATAQDRQAVIDDFSGTDGRMWDFFSA